MKTIIKMIESLKIGPRIFFGFSVVLGFLLITAIASIWSMESSRNNFESYRKNNELTKSVLELETSIIELQQTVQIFTYGGHLSLIETIRRDITTLTNNLTRMNKDNITTTEADLLERMSRHLEKYSRTFERAVLERELRDQLVQQKLPNFRRLLKDLNQVNDDLSDKIMILDVAILNYLNNPFLPPVTKAASDLELFLEKSSINAPIRSKVTEFLATVSRVTQATRGYMFLIGVVMAGESQEIRYAANQLKTSKEQYLDTLASNIIQSSNRAKATSIIVSIFAFLIAFSLAIIIARSISHRLTSITEIFDKLSKGQRNLDVPYRNRKDEIGCLANAANIFKDKNALTESLLVEQRVLSEQLVQNKENLEKSNDELDQFVYTVSHDLKSPLVTSLGYIGMIRALVAEGKPEQALEKLPRIEKSIGRMKQLIYDLLDLSRIGRVDLDKKEICLQSMLQHLITESFSIQIKECGAVIDIDRNMPSINANESRALQAFENLISNSLKYANLGVEQPKIQIGSETSESEHLVYVRDNGCGIEPQYHEKIFGLFQRLDNKVEGTGVGLSVVQKVMKFHKGRVWVESKGQGKGATFWLAFPRGNNSHQLDVNQFLKQSA